MSGGPGQGWATSGQISGAPSGIGNGNWRHGERSRGSQSLKRKLAELIHLAQGVIAAERQAGNPSHFRRSRETRGSVAVQYEQGCQKFGALLLIATVLATRFRSTVLPSFGLFRGFAAIARQYRLVHRLPNETLPRKGALLSLVRNPATTEVRSGQSFLLGHNPTFPQSQDGLRQVYPAPLASLFYPEAPQ